MGLTRWAKEQLQQIPDNGQTCFRCGKKATIPVIMGGVDFAFCSRECMKETSLANESWRIIVIDKWMAWKIEKDPEYLEKMKAIRKLEWW